MGFRVGDLTVASASDDDLRLVAGVTGLSERTVRRRCGEIHGKTLLRNAFRDDWPCDGEGLEHCTVALARDAGLEPEIAKVTALSERTVSHRLSSLAGKMYVRNAFPELALSDDSDDADEDAQEQKERAHLSGAAATPADLLGAVPIVCVRALPHVVAWLAERLETSPRRLRRQLRDDHGRRLLRNFLGDHWPLDVDETAERLLGDLPAAVLRRAPSLIEWVARVAHIRADEVLSKVRQAHDDALAGELFPALDGRGPAPPSPSSVPPEGRRIVAGRWRLIRKLGEGTFGEVYEVQDIEHDIGKFVLKIARGTASAKLLEAEIGLAHKLRHDNICGYHFIGHDDTVGTYLVLDYGGESLDARIRRGGVFDVREALEVARCVAAALDYAHRKGVIHQDVKPSNILIEGHGASREVRLTDFGISRLGRGTERARGGHTIVSTVMGYTPAYAAPEQLLGREARRASDQYSLALVYCSMLEGQAFETRYTPRPFGRLNAKQNAAVARALHNDAERRFESCTDFVRELEGVR